MFTITDLMLGGKRVGYRLNLVDTKLKKRLVSVDFKESLADAMVEKFHVNITNTFVWTDPVEGAVLNGVFTTENEENVFEVFSVDEAVSVFKRYLPSVKPENVIVMSPGMGWNDMNGKPVERRNIFGGWNPIKK